MIQKVLDRQKTASGNEIILTDAGGDGTTVLTIGVFHGDEPLIQVIEKYKPDLILTLHEPYRIVNYDGPASGIAKELSKITGYKVEENIGYPTPGSFGTYCGIERNIPVITLEFAPTVESEDAVLPIETPENLGCLYDKVMEYLADSSIF